MDVITAAVAVWIVKKIVMEHKKDSVNSDNLAIIFRRFGDEIAKCYVHDLCLSLIGILPSG